MRLLLFKGPVESLNHFIDELDIQFQAMGHETFGQGDSVLQQTGTGSYML